MNKIYWFWWISKSVYFDLFIRIYLYWCSDFMPLPSTHARLTHVFITFQSMLFPILINACPAAPVHLNRKSYQEICSAFCANQRITVSFVLWTISRPNTGASQHWDVMGPVENGDTADLRWYVERLFLLHFNHFFFFYVSEAFRVAPPCLVK